MMKQNNILFGIAACCAMMTATSCSQDDILPENNQPIVTEDNATSYVTVSIAAPKGGLNGRATGDNGDNFDNGYAAEGSINSVYLVFYDASGRAIVASDVNLNAATSPEGSDLSVESIYTTEVELQLPLGANFPTQVVAFVNPIKRSDLLVSLQELENQNRDTWYVTNSGTRYFTMNNSVFYKGNNRVIASPVTPKSAGTAENDALNKYEATIYVERMAAKVSVAKKSDYSVTPVQLNVNQTLVFTPEKWALTATEKKTYLIKNLPKDKTVPDQLFAGLGFNFNDETNNRSYWARSYHFDKEATFPMTGCDIKNPDNTPTLGYVSYNDITGSGIEFGKVGEGNEAYCMEHTGRGSRWTNAPGEGYNPYAAFTSVVLVGSYTLEENGTPKTFDSDGFYIYYDQAYSKSEVIAAMGTGQPYVVDADGQPVSLDQLTVRHIHSYSRLENTKIPSDRVALQLNALKGSGFAGLFYKADAATAAVPVTDDNIDEVNNQLAIYANSLARHYAGCKGFFYIPIEHAVSPYKDGALDVKNGSFAVVRNHFYKVTINKISSLANGINDFDDPLLPNSIETSASGIDVTFNVNAWHLMSQSVDL